MKRSWVKLITLVVSLLGCCLLFGCGGETLPVPEVKDVAITAEEGSYGKAGAKHLLSYTVPEGCAVSTAVQLGERAATASDYSYLDGGYYFYTAGEYTVTVYAAKDGMLGSASAKVAIAEGEAFVGEVHLKAAAGETYGKVGALHILSYSAASGSKISVTVEKDGAAAETAVYDAAHGTLVFSAAGQYIVTVTAEKNGSSASGSAEIAIEAEAPRVMLTLDGTSVKEEETVSLLHTAAYAAGDGAASENIAVSYRTGSEQFRAADEKDYLLNGNRFTPRLAGEWKLVFEAKSIGGASASAEATLKCTPAEIGLSAKTEGRLRIQTGIATETSYRVTGAAEKYDVSFDVHGHSVSATAGSGHSVRVTAEETDFFTVTVTYTHKVQRSVQKSLDLSFYSVESLVYAPVWGEDPFCGMPSEVLTNMGHLLYLDAASPSGMALSAADATFEVIENRVTASQDGTNVEILSAGGDERLPYIFMNNLESGVATGNFTLKATVTDPYTGYSAVATKKFNVTPTYNDNAAAASVIRLHVNTYSDFYTFGDLDLGTVGHDCRKNMVLTKTGAILHRSNANWPMNNGNVLGVAGFETAANDCRLEFRFSPVALNPDGAAQLGVGLRTLQQTGWAGYFNVRVANGSYSVDCEFGENRAEPLSLPVDGALYVRIDRRVSGQLAHYMVSLKTEGGEYRLALRLQFALSSSAGNAGAPVAQFQFDHRGSGGCIAVENVRVTNFD